MSDAAGVTVFLDRDGTLNHEKHHLSDPDDLELIPGAAQGLRALVQYGCRLVVVTNQSPIGRGIFDEARLLEIHGRLAAMLSHEEEVTIDGWYWCPHLPDAGCRCRKPEIGMFLQARDELGVDLKRSWMIGDKLIDTQAGRRAGARTVLVATGYGKEQSELPERTECVDFFVPSLREAAELIVEEQKLGGMQ